MIDKNTVFILGAGSSYPYGFPLGIKLRELAFLTAENMFQSFHNKMGGDYLVNELKNARKFARQLKSSGDQSIDWFLKKFPEYSYVGKFSILHHILQAENSSQFLESLTEEKRKQDWYWYLYNEMSKYPRGEVNPELFLRNNVKFITFNYDRSLENFLYTCFSNGHDFEKFGTTAKDLFKKIPIYHVYGKVAPLDWERVDNKPFVGYKTYQQDFNLLDSLKENIHLIDDRESKKNMEIGNLIMNAERIFFLGFSFANENLEMLDIPEVLNQHHRIFGTAFGATENEIRKIRAKFSPNVNTDKLHILNKDSLALLREHL